eukprot:1141533-Pelagomonas_calceolata.AAC.8
MAPQGSSGPLQVGEQSFYTSCTVSATPHYTLRQHQQNPNPTCHAHCALGKCSNDTSRPPSYTAFLPNFKKSRATLSKSLIQVLRKDTSVSCGTERNGSSRRPAA